jgi:hypothetical protein
MDTWGDVSSMGKGFFMLKRIYRRNFLANAENCWGKRLITRKRETKLGSTMQEGKRDAITT